MLTSKAIIKAIIGGVNMDLFIIKILLFIPPVFILLVGIIFFIMKMKDII